MSGSSVVDGLIQKLNDTGLADMPGKALYSGVGTLCPGLLYVLGWNPGGDPNSESDSSARHLTALARKSSNWNEYIDGVWRPGGRVYPPGAAPMQRRVRYLLAGIGLPVVIFVRSPVSSALVKPGQLAKLCWPVHQFLLGLVRPKAILSIGGEPVFSFIRNRSRLLSGQGEFPSGHGTWGCLAARVQLEDQNMAIVSVPHLARYAIDHHPDVVDWVRVKLEL